MVNPIEGKSDCCCLEAGRAGPLRSRTSGRKLGVTPTGRESLVRNTRSHDLFWKWTPAFTGASFLAGVKNVG